MKTAFVLALALVAPGAALVVAVATTPRSSDTDAAPRFESISHGSRLGSVVRSSSLLREVASPVDAILYPAASCAIDRPDDPKALALFASLLSRKAREVGNACYHRMAEAQARKALAIDPRSNLARAALAVAILGQHHFLEALSFVRSTSDETVWRLACEADALVNLGRYDEAVRVAQALVDLKPGPESYPRVATLRELCGDPEGALEVWALALSASPGVGIDRAWVTAQIGDVHLRRGDTEAAKELYLASQAALPGFYLSRLGLARCAIAEKSFERARADLEALVADGQGDIATGSLLGDVEGELGHHAAAEQAYANAVATEARSDSAGSPDRRGLAMFLADHDRDPARAVALARSEFSSCPTIANEDALAWALFKSGALAEALVRARHACRFHTKDAALLSHAGTVAAALGCRDEARAGLREALRLGLRVDPCAEKRAVAVLAGLETR